MSVARFYPYRTVPAGIVLSLDSEEKTLETGPDGALLAIQDQIDTITLRCSVAVPEGILETVLPPTELQSPPVAVQLVYSSVESRKRAAQSLQGDGTVYQGILTLRRRDWRGTVEVQALLIRATANPAAPPGFAADRGSRLSWSEPRRVVFDQPPLPPGDRIDVRWEKFSESTDPWRRSHPRNLFALSTTGDRPTIYVNSDIPRARTILSSLGTQGRNARIRDATNFMIAHQVWSSLLAIALKDLEATDKTLGAAGRLDELRDWQRRLLEGWSQYLYPDEDAVSALEQLVAAADDPIRMGEVMSRLPNAIQERFSTFRGFEGLAREIERL